MILFFSIQNLEDPQKLSGNIENPKNSSKYLQHIKIEFGQISNPPK